MSSLREQDVIQSLEARYWYQGYPYNDSEESLAELHLVFPNDTRIGFEFIEELLLLIAQGNDHVCFEIIGTSKEIRIQFVCLKKSAPMIKGFVAEYLPHVLIQEQRSSFLYDFDLLNDTCHVTEMGLSEEFMRPLKVYSRFEPDPLAGLLSALSHVQGNECALLQVIFKTLRNPWSQSIMWAVTDGNGQSFFQDDPLMLTLAKEKVAKPLFAVRPRMVVYAETEGRAERLTDSLMHSLSPLSRHQSNRLKPFYLSSHNDEDVRDDVLKRVTRRTGMILNVGELASMVHIPDKSIQSPKLRLSRDKTKEVPPAACCHDFALGTNVHMGEEATASLSVEQRLRHMHVIGATGTGKSNFLLGCIAQDMTLGHGFCVLDPHGDLIEKALLHVPTHRLDDVVIIDPSDEAFPVGLNLLQAHSESEKIILSSDLVALFRRFSTS